MTRKSDQMVKKALNLIAMEIKDMQITGKIRINSGIVTMCIGFLTVAEEKDGRNPEILFWIFTLYLIWLERDLEATAYLEKLACLKKQEMEKFPYITYRIVKKLITAMKKKDSYTLSVITQKICKASFAERGML